MEVLITIKNYRCFSDSNPARIKIRKGFTAFIGVNNSGKSTLLKFFYEFRNIFMSLTTNYINFQQAFQRNEPIKFDLPRDIFDVDQVFCNTNNRLLRIEFQFLFKDDNDITFHKITNPKNLIFTIIIPRNNSYIASCKYVNKKITKEIKQVFIKPDCYLGTGTFISLTDNKEMGANNYIVVPYVFDTFVNLSKTVYIGSFRNALNITRVSDESIKKIEIENSPIDYFDMKIGRRFIQNWRNFKESDNFLENRLIVDVTEDIRRVFNFKTLDISSSREDKNLKLTIDNQVYNLSEIGSGIAQFIVVIGNIAIQKPSYILIDEPELNLHPSLQLDFLTTLANYATEGVLFATHSIGLARSSADYIYTVRKTSQGSEVSEYEKNPSLPELLGELSYSTYREFGFDKVLLVEGRTDIKTIQQFLRKYKQDQHILVLSLGGKDYINEYSKAELEEIQRISDKIYILIDSEKNSEYAELEECRKKFQDNCQQIGIHCHILERRATENYFTDRAIKLVKGDKYSELQPYQLLKEASPHWDKSENWRIAKEMTIEELEKTDMGKFLKKICHS